MTEQTGATALSVGISDLLAHRECPRRAAYGARRHTGEGMQNHAIMTPEAGMPATWYGSAIHDAIDALADGMSDDTAIELAWAKWGDHLLPEDLTLLKADLEEHHKRDFHNVRIVLAEDEIKVPLGEMPDGRPIWFRGRIDRLYERLDRPGHFIHVDYKSGKWVKTQDDIEGDLQLWSYNWGLYEYLPEIDELEQYLDQLRGGLGEPVRKSDDQREEIREWLLVNARKYFESRDAEHPAADGLPAPKFNQWCPWCPILESCPVVPQLTDWALSRIDMLRPDDVGVPADQVTPMEEYLERWDDVKTAIAVLERFQESARGVIHEISDAERAMLGFELRDRRNSVVGMSARDALYKRLGHDRFMEMVRVTQEKLKAIEDPEQREWALSLVEKVPGAKVVYRTRR